MCAIALHVNLLTENKKVWYIQTLLDNGFQKQYFNLRFQMAAITPILRIGTLNSVQVLLRLCHL